MISNKRIYALIAELLPHFERTDRLETISSGNLNHVWRLRGKSRNLIVKWAPPYIAANPELSLSPKRIHFEAKALTLFKENNLLVSLASEKIRPPSLLGYKAEDHFLLMEDIGRVPSLDRWLSESGDPAIGTTLGQFIGSLHRQTLDKPSLADQFDNRPIQQTRLQLQYKPADSYALKAGISNTHKLQAKTEALGQKLLGPGRCLVMGDLWPFSLLVIEDRIRIIDWEFAHYGHPLQDIAHLAAHCWMQAHAAASQTTKRTFKHFWDNFWNSYQEETGNHFNQLFDSRELKNAAIHTGSEILVRITGPFKEGYVYDSYPEDHPLIVQAGKKANKLILDEDFSLLWENKFLI